MKSTEELLEELVKEKNKHISLLEFKVDVFEGKCKALEDENKQLKKDKYDLEQEILTMDHGPF
jgi:3-dehydroquinate dehydratase